MKLTFIASIEEDPILKFFKEQGFSFCNMSRWCHLSPPGIRGFGKAYISYNKDSKILVGDFSFMTIFKNSLIIGELSQEIKKLCQEVNEGDLSKLPEIADIVKAVNQLDGEQEMKITLIATQEDPVLTLFRAMGYKTDRYGAGCWNIFIPGGEILLYYFPRSWKIGEAYLGLETLKDSSKLSLLSSQLIEQVDDLLEEINGGDESKLSELANLIQVIDNLEKRK